VSDTDDYADFMAWLSFWNALLWSSYPGPGKWSETSPYPGCTTVPEHLVPASQEDLAEAYGRMARGCVGLTHSELTQPSEN
jgi:hypothetical protein